MVSGSLIVIAAEMACTLLLTAGRVMLAFPELNVQDQRSGPRSRDGVSRVVVLDLDRADSDRDTGRNCEGAIGRNVEVKDRGIINRVWEAGIWQPFGGVVPVACRVSIPVKSG